MTNCGNKIQVYVWVAQHNVSRYTPPPLLLTNAMVFMAEVRVASSAIRNRHDAVARISSCRICGNATGKRFSANGFDWFRCATCGTTQKLLTYDEYQNLNPSYDPGSFLDSRNRDQIEDFLDIQSATRVLSEVADRYLGGPKVHDARPTFLDVGCGMGRYLIAAERLGFDVLGFEPSADHARVAIEHFRLPVINDYFIPEKVAGKVFDLIMLSHVIEHIYDPKRFVHDLVGVLKPGGVLIVITPNNESLVARTIGKSWPMLKPLDHVSLIGARAYAHFDLQDLADVHHSSSEYPYEYVAALLSALKSSATKSRRGRSTHVANATDTTPPPLRDFGIKAKVLRYCLVAASAPMYLAAIAAGRQACLKTVIIRKR